MEGKEIRGNMWRAAIRVCHRRLFMVLGTALQSGPAMSIYCTFSTLLHSWKSKHLFCRYLSERSAMFVVMGPHESSREASVGAQRQAAVFMPFKMQNRSQIRGRCTNVSLLPNTVMLHDRYPRYLKALKSLTYKQNYFLLFESPLH